VPLHYRSVFQVRDANPAEVAREQFALWLQELGNQEVDLSPGRRTLTEGVDLAVAEGPDTARFRLRNSGYPVRLMTTLTAHCEPNGAAWLWLEQEYEASATNVEPLKLRPPGLIRGILRRVNGHDGLAVLTEEPQRVTAAGLDVLIDVLCDDEHQVPVVVASTHPWRNTAEWTEMTRDLTANLTGTAAVYVLDREATDLLDGMAAFEDHKVYGGAVRTYLPGVDPASPSDAARHRVLPQARIVESPGRAKMLLTVLPWQQARTRPLPEALRRIDAGGFESGTKTDVARLLQEPAVVAHADPVAEGLMLRLSAALQEALSRIGHYEQQLRDANARRRVAEDQAYEAERQAEKEILDHDATRTELDSALDQVRWLQSELVGSGLVERAYAPVPSDQRTPQLLSVGELRHHVPRLRRVGVDADWEVAERLDESFKAATWAAKAWRALRALDDYAEARINGEFDRDFYAYCQEPPPGRTGISANVVAMTESDDTRGNRRFAAARQFTVPAEVNPEGKVHMWAHVKLDSTGRTAPRMHFYDDTAGPTGRIHVGYIGPHLPNKQS
jgi:hypothetical protein